MSKSKNFLKLNRKGKLILGFMTVAIVSPIILAACGNSQDSTYFSLLGEKQALAAVSKLLGYKRGNQDAVFQNLTEMAHFYYTGEVQTPKYPHTPQTSSDRKTANKASKSSIFSDDVYYYVVPGYSTDSNSEPFFEGEIKVMQKLYEITDNKFKAIQFYQNNVSKNFDFNAFATSWWHDNYADPQKEVEWIFSLYSGTSEGITHEYLNKLPKLKILLAPNSAVAQALINAYRPYVRNNEWPIVTGQDL